MSNNLYEMLPASSDSLRDPSARLQIKIRYFIRLACNPVAWAVAGTPLASPMPKTSHANGNPMTSEGKSHYPWYVTLGLIVAPWVMIALGIAVWLRTGA